MFEYVSILIMSECSFLTCQKVGFLENKVFVHGYPLVNFKKELQI